MLTEKLGLALSGGGFRASFFHIGVLAQMARLDLLREVAVISTVSGGSIIGAQYYLHVKELLENTPDDDIKVEDYLDIIQKIEINFLKSVQTNFRMRTFLRPDKNIKMIKASYSRSDRIAELYDEELYRNVEDENRKKRIEMKELKIIPKGEKEDFSPNRDNSGRKCKVPILLINATTLNSGHNWRFEASRMGEPEDKSLVHDEVDKNLNLLRPKRYEDIKSKREDFGFGVAVAASACVPGLFPSLSISDLYKDIRVELVDGGVHDNQGIEGLTDNDCTEFVVSDASGQMKDENNPATGSISVLLRSSGILSDRVREEQLICLIEDKRDERSADKCEPFTVAFMHLRKNLKAVVAEPILKEGVDSSWNNAGTGLTPEDFGVDHEVQNLLSHIRTDLDSFTDVEAYSLMMDGYLMSEPELRAKFKIEKSSPAAEIDEKYKWEFSSIRKWMADPSDSYTKQLKVAHEKFFKVFRLSRMITIVTILISAAIIYFLWTETPLKSFISELLSRSITFGYIAILVIGLIIGFIPKLRKAFSIFQKLRKPSAFFVRLFGRVILSLIVSIFIYIHIKVFDRLFLELGKVKKLGDPLQ